MGEGGFEPPKPKQQIYSLPHLTALELSHMKFKWSWWTDLNPRPADYKSAALPTELHQRICFLFCPDDLFIIPHHFIFVKCFLKLFLKLINFFASSCRRRACGGKLPLPIRCLSVWVEHSIPQYDGAASRGDASYAPPSQAEKPALGLLSHDLILYHDLNIRSFHICIEQARAWQYNATHEPVRLMHEIPLICLLISYKENRSSWCRSRTNVQAAGRVG